MSASRFPTVLLFVFYLLAAGAAAADAPGASALQGAPSGLTPDARAHLEVGLRDYQAGRYEQAIREVLEAQAIDPRSEFLFTLGQMERRRGDCRKASEYYHAFMERSDDPVALNAAQQLLDQCQQQLGPGPPPAPSRAPPPANVTVPAIAPTVNEPPATAPIVVRRRWYRDPASAALAAGGLALAGTSAGLFVDSANRTAAAQARYDLFLAERSAAPDERAVAVATLCAGAVLLGVAVVRYLWLRSKGAAAR
jgi:tetratricopeptide (TPR) repeat protein